MVPLSACMKAGRAFPKTAREALRALGAAAQHRAFGLVLLKTQGTVRMPDTRNYHRHSLCGQEERASYEGSCIRCLGRQQCMLCLPALVDELIKSC